MDNPDDKYRRADDLLAAPREPEPPQRRPRDLWKWLGIPAAVLATISVGTWGVTKAWPAAGWETPNGHEADFTEVRMGVANTASFSAALEQRLADEIKDAADMLREQIQLGQDEYTCDKLDAELRELRRQLRATQDDIDIAEDIRRIQERMGPNGLNCARFEV